MIIKIFEVIQFLNFDAKVGDSLECALLSFKPFYSYFYGNFFLNEIINFKMLKFKYI